MSSRGKNKEVSRNSNSIRGPAFYIRALGSQAGLYEYWTVED